MQKDGTVHYLHRDHLSSTSLKTDAGGNVVARRRYHPYGEERYVAGTLPTDFGYTGQRDVPGTGLMHYHARYYHPGLGRFVSADTIVPEPGNPQSLNRYAYVNNNPLKYTDPSGHFEVDEIDRYLEYQIGITDADERQRIIQEWKADAEWWSIIGPGGATYGDVLDGAKLGLLGQQPMNRVYGFLEHDQQNNTFRFIGYEAIIDVLGGRAALGGFENFNSLIKFHEETVDVTWMRERANQEWKYMGGTGYGADNPSPEWKKLGNSAKHGFYSLGFGLAGVGSLAVPEAPATKALGIVALVKCFDESVKGFRSSREFRRSVNAALRVSNW